MRARRTFPVGQVLSSHSYNYITLHLLPVLSIQAYWRGTGGFFLGGQMPGRDTDHWSSCFAATLVAVGSKKEQIWTFTEPTVMYTSCISLVGSLWFQQPSVFGRQFSSEFSPQYTKSVFSCFSTHYVHITAILKCVEVHSAARDTTGVTQIRKAQVLLMTS
jgi:hypothetical protein